MDPDVVNFLLHLLANSPFEVRGAELAKVAELHARATAQLSEAARAVPTQ